jgi:hypothetical protein
MESVGNIFGLTIADLSVRKREKSFSVRLSRADYYNIYVYTCLFNVSVLLFNSNELMAHRLFSIDDCFLHTIFTMLTLLFPEHTSHDLHILYISLKF